MPVTISLKQAWKPYITKQEQTVCVKTVDTGENSKKASIWSGELRVSLAFRMAATESWK